MLRRIYQKMEAQRFLPGENPYLQFGLPPTEVVKPYDFFKYWSIREKHGIKLANPERLIALEELGYPVNVVPVCEYVLELAHLVEPEENINRYLELAEATESNADDVSSIETRKYVNKAIDILVERDALTKKLEEAYDIYSRYQKPQLNELFHRTRDFDESLPTISKALEHVKKTREVKDMVPVQGHSNLRPVYGKRILRNPAVLSSSKNVLRIIYAWEAKIELPSPQNKPESV